MEEIYFSELHCTINKSGSTIIIKKPIVGNNYPKIASDKRVINMAKKSISLSKKDEPYFKINKIVPLVFLGRSLVDWGFTIDDDDFLI